MRTIRETQEAAVRLLDTHLGWICARDRLNQNPYAVPIDEGRVGIAHAHLEGTGCATHGVEAGLLIDDDRSLSADGHHLARIAVADVRRRTARMADLARAGDGSPIVHDLLGRPGRTVPAWAYILHPLIAHAIEASRRETFHHERADLEEGLPQHATNAFGPAALRVPYAPDRTLWRGQAPAGLLLKAEHDLIIGSMAIGTPRTGGIHIAATARETSVTTFQAIPDTLAIALAGRPLGDLVELRPTGLADVDAAVAALRIRSVSQEGGPTINSIGTAIANLPAVTRIHLEPAPWIRAGPDPDAFAPTWNETRPHAT